MTTHHRFRARISQNIEIYDVIGEESTSEKVVGHKFSKEEVVKVVDLTIGLQSQIQDGCEGSQIEPCIINGHSRCGLEVNGCEVEVRVLNHAGVEGVVASEDQQDDLNGEGNEVVNGCSHFLKSCQPNELFSHTEDTCEAVLVCFKGHQAAHAAKGKAGGELAHTVIEDVGDCPERRLACGRCKGN